MMSKTLFACDLDNTLLTPSRSAGEDDICAEVLNGNRQSFFSPQVYELLKRPADSDRIIFLPVTTRSAEQYGRIQFPAAPRFSLICNGAVLLSGGTPDSEWSAMFSDLIEKQLPVMKGLLEKYTDTPCFTSARIVDGIFFFAACTDAHAAREQYERIKRETGYNLMLSGRKLYLFPEGLDKGSAVCLFARRMGCDRIIAAGDSMIDIPMLGAADTAIVPDAELAGQIGAKDIRICPEGERFPEYIAKLLDQEI